ncbi:MAG: hypothetical protein NVS3B20_19910 [Polyangiales bacterium]
MSVRWFALVVVITSVAGCTPKESQSGSGGAESHAASASGSTHASVAQPSASTAIEAMSAAPATAANDPLPSHSDVAKKVRGEVTKQNYKTELDKLEKEIP